MVVKWDNRFTHGVAENPENRFSLITDMVEILKIGSAAEQIWMNS